MYFKNNDTIEKVFKNSVKKFSKNTFLEYPYLKQKNKIKYTYEETDCLVDKYKKEFFDIGLNCNDRVGIMIGNIPEYFIIKLSLNILGISCVPLNCELTKSELEYIIHHSSPKIIITNNKYLIKFKGINFIKNYGLCTFDNLILTWCKYPKLNKNINKPIKPSTEATLLYTSGTTGKPKGCVLSHEYEINAGYNYVNKKGLITIINSKEKIYNCLPVHHVNAGVLSFYAVLLSGNCQIQAERFSASLFWKHIKESKATIFHYLGVMAPILLKKKKSSYEKDNFLRLGVGAGIEPQLHKIFESRFKVPMVELWGMTEMVRCIFDHKKNRKIGQRCFGKPDKSLETKVIDSNGKSIYEKPGEFLIRYRKTDPKKGFFSGYLKNKKATDNAWKGGWFNTGDIVKKDKKGNLYFIDRKKNIIRRAGENISSAEVEANLLFLPFILNCAVIPFPHDIYEEEILAFIVLKNKNTEKKKIVSKIMLTLKQKLAYFKLPYYIQFIDKIPKTSTEKVKKNDLLKKFVKQNKSAMFDVSHYKKNYN